MRRAALPAFLAWVIVCAPVLPARADEPSSRRFVARHICEVQARLERIHANGDRTSSKNRYLILAGKGVSHDYVQCILIEGDSRAYCEAASYAWRSKPGEPTFHLPPASVTLLEGLGFRIEGDGPQNYGIERPLGDAPAFGALAAFMLSTLHDVYHVDEDTPLDMQAPLARAPRWVGPGGRTREGFCPPATS